MTTDPKQSDASRATAAAADTSSVGNAQTYEPPVLTLIGSLADLTRGGSVGGSDGFGGAGASGELP